MNPKALAVLVQAFVFSDDAGDAVAFVNQFRTAEFFEQVYARVFDQATHPLHQFVERDDVVAGIVKGRRRDGDAVRMFFREDERGGIGDRRIQRRGFLKVRNKFGKRLGVHDRAGKLVRADLAALFEDINIFGGKFGFGATGVVLLDEVCEMQSAGEPCGSRTDDQYVRFQLFPLNGHSRILSNNCLAKSGNLAGIETPGM